MKDTKYILASLLMLVACAGAAQEAVTEQASVGQDESAEIAQDQSGTRTEATTPAAVDPTIAETQTIAVEAIRTESPEPVQEGEEHQRLDDVIVTATKRAKSAREIPVSINAMYGEDLEKQGARDIKDFITQVPGITLQEGSYGEAGDRRITIRGVGPGDLGGQAGNQTVGQFIGDIPMTDPYANFVTPDLDPYDLKTVEILKGPQGTTFGASALNGAIRYVPNVPELEKLGARGFVDRLSVKDGSADYTYGAALNAPLGEKVALRAVGVLQHAPGVYDNLRRDEMDADSRRKWSVRGMALWEPTERSSTTLMYQKQRSVSDDLLLATNPNGEFTDNHHPGPSSLEVGFDLASLDSRYELDDWGTVVVQLSAQNKHALLDLDSGIGGSYGLAAARAYGNYQTKGYTGEIRLVSPDAGNWNWIIGAFVQNYRIDAEGDVYVANTGALNWLAGLPGAIITPRGISVAQAFVEPVAREASLYGELVRKLGERWEVTAGARFYNTSMKGSRYVKGLLSAAYISGTTATFNQKEQGLSPKLSVAFKPWKNILTYVTVARGFQFGGVNAPPVLSLPFNNPATGTPVPVDFDSSVLWNHEIGVRTDWFERTLRVDLTAFYLDWSKAQFGQSSGGSVYSTVYTDNVGKVKSQGLEGTITYLTPLPGLTLNLAGSYIQATTAAEYDPGDGEVIAAGTDMPATPRVQTVTSLQYSRTLGPWITSSSLMHSYWSKAYNNLSHQFEIYDFQTVSGTFSISRPDWSGQPTLALGVTNIADERALMNHIAASTGGAETWTYARPRAISLRLSADFY